VFDRGLCAEVPGSFGSRRLTFRALNSFTPALGIRAAFACSQDDLRSGAFRPFSPVVSEPECISLASRKHGLVLALRGAVDLYVAAELREHCVRCLALSSEKQPVLVQCAALERLDASALQLLLGFERSLRARGCPGLLWEGLSERVKTYLSLAGLERWTLGPAAVPV
jgi:anti-anti-sigma factor